MQPAQRSPSITKRSLSTHDAAMCPTRHRGKRARGGRRWGRLPPSSPLVWCKRLVVSHRVECVCVSLLFPSPVLVLFSRISFPLVLKSLPVTFHLVLFQALGDNSSSTSRFLSSLSTTVFFFLSTPKAPRSPPIVVQHPRLGCVACPFH